MVLPLPASTNQQPIEWKAGTTPEGEPILGLNAQDFEAHAENQTDLLRWIKQAMYQLQFYQQDRKPKD